MRCTKWSGIAAVAFFCLIGSLAMSDDKKQPADAAAMGMDPAMMEAWAKYMTPGEHHQRLESMAGKFKYVNKWRMDPKQEWVSTEGDYEGEMIFGGKFLACSIRGDMMGQPFEGMGVLGYDNALKKHISGWIDNMGTGMMRSEGDCDSTGRIITFEGEMVDPMTNQPTKYKYVYNIESDDRFTMRWWSPDPATGELFESMVIEYTRVQ